MLKAYDISVKKLIEVFANNIPVIGLQNDDSTETSESVMAQASGNSVNDVSSFPVISVFRGPELTITDGAMTKRPSTYLGYVESTSKGPAYLVSMRGDLEYTIDVFDTTRASAEKIALQLYFRLRNNPQIDVTFDFKDFDYQVNSISDLQMNEGISHQKINDKSRSQVYKIRMGFKLANVLIYDMLGKEPITEIKYSIEVRQIGGADDTVYVE